MSLSRSRKVAFVLAVSKCIALTSFAPGADPAFPLKVAESHRCLVDQKGQPYFINAEAGWRILWMISPEELKTYLDDRKAKGFNTILCQLVPDGKVEGESYGDRPNQEGQHAFIERDFSKPNPAYWVHIDNALTECVSRGFLLLVSTHYLGCCQDGWHEILENAPNSDDKAKEYGRWIGERYKDVPNIVWVGGGDHNETRRSILICEGIAEKDPNHVQTFHPSAGQTARSRLPDAKWLSLDATYTYYPGMEGRTDQFHVYAQSYVAWSRKPAMPFVMSESAYEEERDAPPQFIRRQAYWSYLGGACGHVYGHVATWSHPAGWLSKLNDPGARHVGLIGKAFLGRPWHELEPDWSHNVVIAGRGVFNSGTSPGGDDYATASRTKDGRLVLTYLPTSRTVTVQMKRLVAPVLAEWFDPTSGDVTKVEGGPFENSGNRDFAPPGKNKGGDGDWLLVLEAQVK